MKKSLEAKVSFLRSPLPVRVKSAEMGAKVRFLRTCCIRLLCVGYQRFPRVERIGKVSSLRMVSHPAAMGACEWAKVRFLRTVVLVTHCIFVIYNKVSLT